MEKEQYLASPPEVEVKNTIGAGDSAVAAGTATTSRAGTALWREDDFLKLVPKINLEER